MSTTRTNGDSKLGAAEVWREKLEYYLSEEAKASDPARRYELRKLIEEAHSRIEELISTSTRSVSAENSERPSNFLERKAWLYIGGASVLVLLTSISVFSGTLLSTRDLAQSSPATIYDETGDKPRDKTGLGGEGGQLLKDKWRKLSDEEFLAELQESSEAERAKYYAQMSDDVSQFRERFNDALGVNEKEDRHHVLASLLGDIDKYIKDLEETLRVTHEYYEMLNESYSEINSLFDKFYDELGAENPTATADWMSQSDMMRNTMVLELGISAGMLSSLREEIVSKIDEITGDSRD